MCLHRLLCILHVYKVSVCTWVNVSDISNASAHKDFFIQLRHMWSPHGGLCNLHRTTHTHTYLHTQTETYTHKSLNIVVAIWQAVSSFIQYVNIHPDKLYARTPAPLCLLLKAAFLKANYQCLGIEMGQRLAWLSSRHTDPLLPVLVRRHSRQAHTCRHTDRHTHTEFHL